MRDKTMFGGRIILKYSNFLPWMFGYHNGFNIYILRFGQIRIFIGKRFRQVIG